MLRGKILSKIIFLQGGWQEPSRNKCVNLPFELKYAKEILAFPPVLGLTHYLLKVRGESAIEAQTLLFEAHVFFFLLELTFGWKPGKFLTVGS